MIESYSLFSSASQSNCNISNIFQYFFNILGKHGQELDLTYLHVFWIMQMRHHEQISNKTPKASKISERYETLYVAMIRDKTFTLPAKFQAKRMKRFEIQQQLLHPSERKHPRGFLCYKTRTEQFVIRQPRSVSSVWRLGERRKGAMLKVE